MVRKGLARISATLGVLLTISLTIPPAHPQVLQPDFMQMNMEELLDLEVTSVSRKPQKVSDAAAAVYVITQQEIRRSGATSIPEVLRLAPGLHVARLDTNKWAISSRGFSNLYANKLLVLVDGRTIYNDVFGGVIWQARDFPLEDIERIEVIRGPGASVWGVNAVNGIINIITKTATDTPGALITGSGGVNAPNVGFMRQGGRVGDELAYRVYAKYLDEDGSVALRGQPARDERELGTSGFRIDWKTTSRQTLSISGDAYRAHGGEVLRTITSLTPPSERDFAAKSSGTGGSLLTQWTDHLSDDSEIALQFFYDQQSFVTGATSEHRHTLDFDFKHERRAGSHEFIWGGNYRSSLGESPSEGYPIRFDPARRHDHLFSGFGQDEIALAGDLLHLTLGSKLDYNNHHGADFQPNARVLWNVSKKQALWFAISKAARTPSRLESDVRGMGGLLPPEPAAGVPFPMVFSYFGSPDLPSETVRAHEVGYRQQIGRKLSFDFDGFYNVYSDLRSYELGASRVEATAGYPRIVIPVVIASLGRGESYGVEASGDARLRRAWRISGNYSFYRMQFHLAPGSTDVISEVGGTSSPTHQFQFRTSLDLSRSIEADLGCKYVSSLSALGVPAYTSVDARVGWKLSPNLELAVVGQNLLDPGHLEFAPNGQDGITQGAMVQRGGYAKFSWHF